MLQNLLIVISFQCHCLGAVLAHANAMAKTLRCNYNFSVPYIYGKGRGAQSQPRPEIFSPKADTPDLHGVHAAPGCIACLTNPSRGISGQLQPQLVQKNRPGETLFIPVVCCVLLPGAFHTSQIGQIRPPYCYGILRSSSAAGKIG